MHYPQERDQVGNITPRNFQANVLVFPYFSRMQE